MGAIGERIISILKKSRPHVLYGRSSNQEMLQVPIQCDIHVDDYVFIRPTQSEAIIPQFAQLYVYAEGKVSPVADVPGITTF